MSGTLNKPPASAAQTVEQQRAAQQSSQQTPAQQVTNVAATEANEQPRQRSRHQQSMDAVLARRQEQLEDELVASDEIMAASPPPPEDVELDENGRAAVVQNATQQSVRARQALPNVNQQTLNRSQPQQQQPNQQGEQRINVPINGQMVALTNKEITDLINIGADAVRQASQPIQQQQPRPQPQPQPQPRPQPFVPPTINTASAKRLVQQLAFGNEDEAAIAMQDIIATAVMIAQAEQAKINPQIVNVAVENAAIRIAEKKELDDNLAIIEREYPDLMASALKGTMAAHALVQIRNRNAQTGRQQSNLDSYREACQIVRRELGLPQQQQQVVQTNNINNMPNANPNVAPSAQRTAIAARKQGASQQPVSAGRAGVNVAVAAQANGARSGSDIVNEMRKSRGQTVN